MFPAVLCSSSGGQIILLQHLVSSLFVYSRAVCRLRTDSADSALNRHTAWLYTKSDNTRCCNNII